MKKALSKVLDIQPDEMRLFLWTAGLVLLIRASSIIFNNFGETAFLKRFGVEFLPLVYMANSIVTFVIMGAMTGMMTRLPSARMLGGMLLFCGASVAALRLVVIGDFEFIYPVIFLLKAQYEALLSLVFWNLANDLFNTRQSKRIFPLVTAGGVIGGILGSFGTPPLARAITINNLMLVYLGTTAAAALVLWRMSMAFPTLKLRERTVQKTKKRASIFEELKKVGPLIKQSTLVKILVLLTFIPNVLIPIMNYQFNFAIDEAFKTEAGMIDFFGYFRGVLNVISLVILLFVGKLYSRWGLPVALMFHPANYILAFGAFLLRFDIFSAMYARISTNVIRTTINNPARDILMGLFPPEFRPLLRPFLRGTVVRIGVLLGSGFIMLYEGWLHPKYLSVIGMAFGLGWLISSAWLKRAYSDILLGLVSDKVVDFKSLEASEAGQVFKDKAARKRLVQACRIAKGPACVLYAEMMTSQGVEAAGDQLLDILVQKDPETIIGLLPLVSDKAGAKAVKVFSVLADPKQPALNRALAKAAARMGPEASKDFLLGLYEDSQDLQVRSLALMGLYAGDPVTYRPVIEQWLSSPDTDRCLAGIQAAGGSGDQSFLPVLKKIYQDTGDAALDGAILEALNSLKDPELPGLVVELLNKRPERLPLSVLEDFEPQDERSTRALVLLMGNEHPALRRLARRKLEQTPQLDLQVVIESLATPNRRIREGLLSFLAEIKVSDLDIINFARTQMQAAYQNLAESRALALLPAGRERELLRNHMEGKAAARGELLLRVLATQDKSPQMRILVRGIASSDDRLRSNAVEALETILGRQLSKAMIPLLEGMPVENKLDVGRKGFKLREKFASQSELLGYLLGKRSWVTRYLAMVLIIKSGDARPYAQAIEKLTGSENQFERRLAKCLKGGNCVKDGEEAAEMAEASNISDKILHLRGMDLFRDLRVSELAAIASLMEQESFKPGDKIISEGDVGESMYLITKGRVTVHKDAEDGCEVELADLGTGDYFGEMALFDDQARSATVIAEEPTDCLVLYKMEFSEAVHEYPQVALQICTELSRRLRELHQKIQALPVCV